MCAKNINDSIETINENKLIDDAESISNKSSEETRKFLLTEDHFEKMKEVQREIFEKTEVSPSIRKIVNMLIAKESIDNLKDELIRKFEE